MKKQLQVLGHYDDQGSFVVTHKHVSKEMADSEHNKHLNLKEGFVEEKSTNRIVKPCPADTPQGYWSNIGGNCVFTPYS